MIDYTIYDSLQRGDATPCGGIYVGRTSVGCDWVARPTARHTIEESFAIMCVNFDEMETRKVTGIRSEKVIELAELLQDNDSQCNVGTRPRRATRTTITRTTIEAPRSFFQDLAYDLLCEADRWGDERTIAEANYDIQPEFVEAADRRIADSLRRWSYRLNS
jgi:hypothetical protein